jgi:hypothetical protein
MIEVKRRDWYVALCIFQEQGWSPVRPIGTYLPPLGFVPQDEGKAMHRAGRSLFSKINAEPALSVVVPMDLELPHWLTAFVGGGAFIVGRKGAFANAQANDFSETESI